MAERFGAAKMPLQPAPALIASTIEELRHYAPFDAMDQASLNFLTGRLRLGYFPQGSSILTPDDGVANRLLIVQKGVVSGIDKRAAGEASAMTLTEGECFPLGALIARRPALLTYSASSDTFCYQLDAKDFDRVMDMSSEFRHFAVNRLAAMLEQSRQQVQSRYTARIADTGGLSTPLKSLVRRPPVTVGPGTTVRRVLETMHSERVGSVVIVDDAMRPLGIFTGRDVLDRIALAGIAQEAPIETAMTREPFSLPSHAPLFEAVQAMALHRFRHVIVMEEGRVCGMVSERDLFTLQRLSLGEIAKSIDRAGTVDELAGAASEVRRLAAGLLAHGVDAEHLTQFVTTLNDAVVQRVLTLAAREAPPPAAAWCWLGLGSEGRMEQTLSTDQDNAILFAAGDTAAAVALRPAFLAFAEQANAMLDRCGFPLCRGDIMAKNPQWCLSSAEWRETFGVWIRNANPAALLNAAIFFDFRAVAGDASLAGALRAWLNSTVPAHPLFLREMVLNALQIEPPLGIFRDFVVNEDKDFHGTIDLKMFGARPFIDAARILALATGVSVSNTAERLRIAGPRMRMHEDEIGALVDGFHFVQLLRLRNHEAALSQRPAPSSGNPAHDAGLAQHANRIDPQHLNLLDRRILRESFRQARTLQSRLRMDFQA